MIDYTSIIPPGSSVKILYPLRFWETRSFLAVGIGVVLVAVAIILTMWRSRGFLHIPAKRVIPES